MHLWKIVPVAPPADPRWQDHRIWREVVVCAESAAMARLLAGEMEREDMERQRGRGESAIGIGNETLDWRSAFVDEKLYWVTEMDGPPGTPGVRHAELLETERHPTFVA